MRGVVVMLEERGADGLEVPPGTQPMWNAKGHILIPDISSDVVRFRIKNNNWGKK